MRLYHFTNLAAMVGKGGMCVLQGSNDAGFNNVAAIASPDSILKAGLRPHWKGHYDHLLPLPLPECVWLTTNPEMPNCLVNKETLDAGNWRATVVIPESDRRLFSWSRYWRKKTGYEFILANENKEYVKEAARFFVYFGSITLDQIRAFDNMPNR
jgi:hypothetical protein